LASIEFRRLEREDFPRLRGWLLEPLVARWWNHETSPEALERDFGPGIDGRDEAEYFIAAKAGSAEPFGLIQRYPIEAWSEYLEELSAVCEVQPGTLSIDYLIGEPASRGRGLGAEMIASFVAESWPRYPDAERVLVPVAVGNEASWRALEKAGFSRIAEGDLKPDNPIDPPLHFVYGLTRSAD
jgi:aminoglycoside 6'-N-acetyltransferase